MRTRCFVMIFCLATAFSASAATMEVATVTQLQNALSVAASNREDDVISIAEGTYYLESTLSYRIPTNENKSLTLQCRDGEAILDAGTIYIGTMRGLYIVTSGTVAHVKLEGLSIRNGRTQSPELGAGAFIYLRAGNLTLERCSVIGNTANELFNPVDAAGLFLKVDNPPARITLRECVFSNNYSKGTGGGAYITAGYGTTIGLTNNCFVTNFGSTKGGGAYIYVVNGSVTLDNNTFTRNTTGFGNGGGGAYITLYSDDSIAILRNNIMWGNTADNGIGQDAMFEDDPNGNLACATVTVFNCDFADFDYQLGDHVTLVANTNADPLLTEVFHLRADSPCIDSGTNLAWMAKAVDMDGHPRIFNGRVDMGADETFLGGVRLSVSNIAETVWDTIHDAVCHLEFATNEATPTWQDVGAPATATSRRITLIDPDPADNHRRYQLQWTR